jgi:hypothetical protein
MAGKIFARLVGTLACVAAFATAWDAEAGWRHRHCGHCCYTPCCVSTCYTPCCENRCTVSCDSCCYRPACCGYAVVEEVVLPTSCCNGGIVSTSKESKGGQAEQAKSVVATAVSAPATKAAKR